jgi:hypothetical protein
VWGIAKDATGGFHLGISLLPTGFILAASVVLWLGRQTKVRGAAEIGIADKIA